MAAPLYKSRLFNLLNRQSIKVKVRLGRSLRQFQNSVDLGLQILLYPIYFIVQSARQAQKTLSQSLHYKRLPLSAPPEAEILYPLDRVLEKVGETPELASAIATDLHTHQLVFLSPEQEILDIIEPAQQRQLDREIKTAIANYYYDLRLKAKFSRKAPGLMPGKQTKVLAPIRWFWQLMSWEQQREVALSIDLFGESGLPPPAPLPPSPPPIFVALDEKLARLDTPAPPPETTYKVYIWRLYWLIYGAIDHYFGTPADHKSLEAGGQDGENPGRLEGGRENLPARIKFFSQYLQIRIREWLAKQESDEVLDTIKEDPFTIAALIKAAVDHYFRPPASPAIAPATIPPTPEDPWLSWTDLYAPAPVVENRESESAPPGRDRIEGKIEEILKKLPQGKPGGKKRLNNPAAVAIANLNKPKAIEKKTVTPSRLVIFTEPASSLASVEEGENSLTPFAEPYTDPIFDAYEPGEWVETGSVSGGYVKHPLERILDGLDTIILWVENMIINVWRGIKSLLRKNKRKKN